LTRRATCSPCWCIRPTSPTRWGLNCCGRRLANASPLRKVWADAIDNTGALAVWVAEHWPTLDLEIVRRPAGTKGFVVQPRRWVIERTFAWLTAHRLLSKEYERLPWHTESWIILASIRILIKR